MRNTSNKLLCPNVLSFLIPLYLFFPHFFPIPITGDSPPLYNPTEIYTVDCGASGNLKARDNRIWIGDANSGFSLIEKTTASIISKAANPSPSVDPVPFATARLSRFQFAYTFPVTAGQKFIRLHFYPSSVAGFDRSKAVFSVKTGGYTLLNNFSPSLAADARGDDSLSREFCVNVKQGDQLLNITFTPTASDPDAYAFINGIEVVSMPDYLYYTPPQNGGLQFIGQKNIFRVETEYALEVVYRLNVGGRFVSPMKDTGMYRTWDQDDDYCVKPAFVPANSSIDLKFTQQPEYTAPPEVYRTARTMGNNKTENMAYNLTWVLPVDSGFNYLLRLHFCEFQPEIKEQHDREFTIFIANQTAENHADVISWSGRNGVPTYRDYGVMMASDQGRNKRQELYIQLHPNPDWRTRYNDAILNGIELFKVSNFDNSLARPNPDPSPNSVPPPPAQSTSPKNHNTELVAIVSGMAACVVAVFTLRLFIRRRGGRRLDANPGASWWGPFSYTSAQSTRTGY